MLSAFSSDMLWHASSQQTRLPLLLLGLLMLLRPCGAQFLPPLSKAANMTTMASPLDPTIKITYTVPRGICTTAFAAQQQITGWVSLPGEIPTHIFFWFIGARESTEMLSVYLNGGPGSSSLFGLFAESGPCEVVEKSAAKLGTVAREWGWDRASNMLYIDQPDQVGFSYDIPTNGTMDFTSQNITVPPVAHAQHLLVRNGTFASQRSSASANTTAAAARAIYHVMQAFLAAFPQYNPPGNTSLGISLFAESYGGKYGPAMAAQWQAENARRRISPAAAATSVDIHLAALGLINGCVDSLVEGPHLPAMMVNNTYGVRALSPLQASMMQAGFRTAGQSADLIGQCRAAVAASDPGDYGNASSVNSLCYHAVSRYNEQMLNPYTDSGLSYYDITAARPASFPPSHYIDYLNSALVQQALGSPVNYTDTSPTVYAAFLATGDAVRGAGLITDMAALLEAGVRVSLIYGDRDLICNWLGGEAVSLAIAAAAGGSYASKFPAAGYAPIIVNTSYIGGVVRQFGNLSFSRIYQAGHFVPAYQPETAFQVFARIILGTDLGTGEAVDLRVFNTSGPANATHTEAVPKTKTAASPTCYLANAANACADDQLSSLRAGSGVVINDVWYAASSDWPGVTATDATTGTTGTASGPVTATSASGAANTSPGSSATPALASGAETLTGIFTATATPGAAVARPRAPNARHVAALALSAWLLVSASVP